MEAAEELVKNAEFTLDMDNSTGKQVYFKLTLTTDEHVATVIFEDEHHTWTYLEVDGKVLVDNRRPTTEMLIPANDVDWNEFTIENIYNWCKTADISEFGRAKEAVAMNKILAQDGIDNPRGIQTARVLMDNIESGFVAPDEDHPYPHLGHRRCWMPAWAAVIIPPWSALPAATRALWLSWAPGPVRSTASARRRTATARSPSGC